MQPPVKIQKEGRHINVYFSYNQDLVDIMREKKGWWIRKKKCWMFPASRKTEIINTLEENKYRVKILPDVEQKQTQDKKLYNPTESFKDKDVVAVWGVCKKCGNEGFVNRNGICTKCSLGL